MDPHLSTSRLDLLQRLTAASPSWGVWKNVGSALSGTGDIDSVASPEEVPIVERIFAVWAVERGLGPVFRCDHGGGLMDVLAAPDRARGTLVELDLTWRKTYRGSTLFRANDVMPMLELDRDGFRRIRPGAEGVILLFHNGVRRWGRPDPAGLAARRIRELIGADPQGAELASRLFGRAGFAARRAARRAAAGAWDRPAALAVELWFLVRTIAEPAGVARRVWFRAVTKSRCPIIRAAYSPGRRLPADVDAWLTEASATHQRLDVDVER